MKRATKSGVYVEIISRLLDEFKREEISGVDCFRKIRKVCIVASAVDSNPEKYEKLIDEIDKITKKTDHIFTTGSENVRDILGHG